MSEISNNLLSGPEQEETLGVLSRALANLIRHRRWNND